MRWILRSQHRFFLDLYFNRAEASSVVLGAFGQSQRKMDPSEASILQDKPKTPFAGLGSILRHRFDRERSTGAAGDGAGGDRIHAMMRLG